MANTGPNFYRQLERLGHTNSQRDYSSYYLNMAPNYACLRGDRGPSPRALINLFRRLWEDRRYWLAFCVAREILFHSPRNEP